MLEVVADVFDVLADDAAEGGHGVGRHRGVVCRIYGRGCLSCKCKMP